MIWFVFGEWFKGMSYPLTPTLSPLRKEREQNCRRREVTAQLLLTALVTQGAVCKSLFFGADGSWSNVRIAPFESKFVWKGLFIAFQQVSNSAS